MRNLPLLVAGIAGLAVAGTVALAAGPAVHEITVRLPGGGIEHIEYTGDVAPRVTVSQNPFDAAWPDLIGVGPSFVPSFAMVDRMAAQMDREMAAFREQAESLRSIAMPDGQGLNEAALRNLPPGTVSYSSVSFSTGSGMCSRSVEVTRSGNGSRPQVVSRSSGDCGAAGTGNRARSNAQRPDAQDNAPIPIRYEVPPDGAHAF